MALMAWLPTVGFALAGLGSLAMWQVRRRPSRTRADAAPLADLPTWNGGCLQGLTVPRFEALCAAMFVQDGIAPSAAPGRAVRCMAAQTDALGVDAVQTFRDAMRAEGAASGILITGGEFTREARAAAMPWAVTLVDGKTLSKLISQRSVRQQLALLAIVQLPGERRVAGLTITPLPTPAWLAVAGTSFLGAWLSLPDTAPAPSRPAIDAAPFAVAHDLSRTREEPMPTEAHRPRSSPATIADLDPEVTTAARPAAGRQVLRCTGPDRVTYAAVGTVCAEGIGQEVTVFPTQGVNRLR